VNKLAEYFHTDWSAMTLHDWIGLIITIVVFVLMVWLFLYVFNPKRKQRFESQRHLLDDENLDTEKDNE